MSSLREWMKRWSGFRNAVSHGEGAHDDAELRAEMEAHFEMVVAEYVERGMTVEDARRRARLEAGSFLSATENVRRQRSIPMLETTVRDLRQAWRALIVHRSYSAAVLITLALGTAATVSMFTILNAVLIRSLPYPAADRIVSLSVSDRQSDMQVVDNVSYDLWANEAVSVVAMALYRPAVSVAQTPAGPRELRGISATAPYFQVMGVAPILGRVFTPEETERGAPPVVLLSESIWREAFGADSAVVGTTVDLDGSRVTIIGVMPADFASKLIHFWRPHTRRATPPGVVMYFRALARLADGASVESFRAELETIQRRARDTRPAAQRVLEPVVMTLRERRFGDVRPTLLMLFAAVAVLLLITCANLANLTMARAIRRRGEYSVRLALGASRLRIVRFALTESFMLSVAGSVSGLLLAQIAVRYFVAMSPGSVANAEGITVDGMVIAFTAGVTVLTTLLFGLAPAIMAGRNDANLALSSSAARSTGSRRQRTMRRALVVFELATALVLLVGAGLVARSFWIVTAIQPGFDAEHVTTATISLPWSKYSDTTAKVFMDQLLARVRAQPGVRSAALTDAVPLTGVRMTVDSDADSLALRYHVVGVTPGYFESVGTRILEGRAIDASHSADGAGEVVLGARLAHRLFPGKQAVGQSMSIAQQDFRIVGISEDVRQTELEGESSDVAFVSLATVGGWNYLQLVVRSEVGETALAPAITRIVHDLDPRQPPPAFKSMEKIVEDVVAPRRFVFVLLAIFAVLAGALSVVGLYGVLSYLVSEQTREIGIRVALGASRRAVLQFVLGQGAIMTMIGVTSGLAAAVALSRLMESMVYEVSVRDVSTFAAGSVLLIVVSMLASLLPARRASRVDPIVALRNE